MLASGDLNFFYFFIWYISIFGRLATEHPEQDDLQVLHLRSSTDTMFFFCSISIIGSMASGSILKCMASSRNDIDFRSCKIFFISVISITFISFRDL